MWAIVGLVSSLFFISACTIGESTRVASSGRISPTYQGPAETTYCSSVTAYGGSTSTITGSAQYTRRNPWGGSSGGLGSASTSGTHPATTQAIRRAEVRVTDPSGAVVQCAETLNDGSFSFILPQGSVNYTVSINSRGYNSYIRASVLNRPEQNLFYSISTTVTPTAAAHSVGIISAAADGEALGAAFHILDRFLSANEYLVTTVGSCTSTDALCPDFTVAPKVTAYWELGYNPNSYFGASSGLSFYLPGYSRLFILGGINGNVNSADTDHFDPSVILHEYGHFLEDAMFYSDSPGGSHNGNRVIDPRLAWSEGWGNFFQAAVLNQAAYVDTSGNDDGSTGIAYYANIESGTNDIPTQAGEGAFREFSVTRLLWDAVDGVVDGTDNVSNRFNEIWASLMKTSNGFRDGDYAFRNAGHLHLSQNLIAGHSDWSPLRTTELHGADTTHYAQYRVASGACATVGITPTTGGNPINTHMSQDNDFYHINISSGGSYTYQLQYDDTGGVGTLDLDLLIYSKDGEFGTSTGLLADSRATPTGTTNQTEQFTVSLPAGNYLLVVTSFSGAPQTGTYVLRQNGAQLCPGTL
jgi:hypothetical protein